MNKIEKIRAEIERRIAEYDKWIEEHPIQAGGSPIRERREELASLKEDFLDTLSEESDKSLEEAAESHIREVVDAAGHPGWDWTTQDVSDAFIAGAKLQKEQMMKGVVVGLASTDEDEHAYNRGYFDGFNAGKDFITDKRVREGSASKCEAVGAVLQKRYNIIAKQILPRQTDEKMIQWYLGRISGLVDAMELLDSSEESIRIELEEKK